MFVLFIRVFKCLFCLSGCSNIKQAKINLLSAEDGKPSIIKVTKQLCHLVQTSQYRVEDIVPNNVDTFFQGNYITRFI